MPLTTSTRRHMPLLFWNYFRVCRRGPELSPQTRARICELRSLGWSYDRIQKKHPEFPYLTIRDTCRKEAQRLNNVSKPRTGAPRVITEEERDSLLETATLTPEISCEDLQAQECPNADWDS
jgi:hypothetical protein